MVHSHLLPASLPVLGWAWVSCLYRHVQRLPIVRTQVCYTGALHDLKLIRAEELPWPLLLGRDTPHFASLLRQATQEETVWATDDDPEEGPFGERSEEALQQAPL